jgi:RNA polymerase sigma factor (TIGR02999 family)
MPESTSVPENYSVDQIFSLFYEDLRRIASSVRRGDPHQTLRSTVLVNEAWMKMKDSARLGAMGRTRLLSIAARAMRQVLIDAARHRNAWGGRDAIRVEIDDAVAGEGPLVAELLAVNQALDRLGKADSRQVRLVELKFFAGMTDVEIAEELGISLATVSRSWKAARAWLKKELRPAG